ncbi:MAG: mechanosensitive ion channel family protein [Candidatus Melainabacteria bacterium]|nr:mechanosensitive ion channel family protein [Candidatus Melainabacteria bacterium]
MFKHLKPRKLIPLIIVFGLASLIAGTDVLSAAVQKQVIDLFKSYAQGLVPYTANICVGLIFICLMNLLYDPMKVGLDKALNLSHADERGRRIVSRAVLLLYWVVVIIVGVSFIAPDFLSKLVVGFGLFGAAIALALQGIANDFIAGVLLNFRPKFCVGDDIELVGVAVKGKVTDIGYVLTVLDTADGTYTVPNREVWSRPVKVTKAGGSPATTGSAITCPAGVTAGGAGKEDSVVAPVAATIATDGTADGAGKGAEKDGGVPPQQ